MLKNVARPKKSGGDRVKFSSNLVFSEWERIFKDPMTTAAAIDRLVHHSVIAGLMKLGE
jgi:DNA replication protein DnaC